jgi:hypothetical protein
MYSTVSRIKFVLLCVLMVTACARPTQNAPARSGSVILQDEIAQHRRAGVRDVLELIERARPRWLQLKLERNAQFDTPLIVFVNETRLNRLETLRNYPLDDVASIRYLDAAEAGLLAGASGHVGAAIVVHTGHSLSRGP